MAWRSTRVRALCGGIVLIVAWSASLQIAVGEARAPQAPGTAPPVPPMTHRAVLDRYCVTCHNQRLRTAGLALDSADLEHVATDAAVWEKVVRKLQAGAMPPVGVPRPDAATLAGLTAHLEQALDRAAEADPNPGRSVVHRLNRAEYANAVRDLLGLEIDSRALLPADDSGYGFDNIAEVLSVSPALLDRYLSAAQKISRLAVGDPTLKPVVTTYDIPNTLPQDVRMSDELPFGSRGGAAIHHDFPLDGEYVIRLRLRRNLAGEIYGLDERHQMDVRLDGRRLQQFSIGGEGKPRMRGPQAVPAGEDANKEGYERTADEGLELRVPVTAGRRVIGVSFLERAVEPEGVKLAPSTGLALSLGTEGQLLALGRVTVAGPYSARVPKDTPSRQRIFVCRPESPRDEDACARRIVSNLARRAYRRPATAADIDTLLSFYKDGRRTAGFDGGIQAALERVLLSPHFLFRVDADAPPAASGHLRRISDVALASRLSFFLWSSIPDDELLAVAEAGKLSDPSVLERQARRMLADPRAEALMANFAGQWLHLRKLRVVKPDPDLFLEFDDSLRDAFQRETELFVQSQVREDRGVPELLSARYTYLNERLAKHYGINDVYGSHFRRVALADPRRGGLLAQASILTVTSQGNRTSPVVRGKWLLDNVLGTPPPPPPANVPDLPERGEDGQPRSVRERMEQHRRNPVCASCHRVMDPLGFALENFDAIGRWRTVDEGAPIDASGGLPDGTRLTGPAELRAALLRRPDAFVTVVTEKLLTYALGRGVEHFDAPVVRKIVRESAPGGYRWSAIILGVVESMPFQMRRSES